MSDDEYFNEIMEEIERLRAENEKLRAALDCFLEQATPTQWRYSRERAEKLAKGILAAAALKETGDDD